MTAERWKILMVVLSNVNPDVRVEKEARYMASIGHDVTVIAIDKTSTLPVKETRDDYLILRVPIKKKLFFKYFEFWKKTRDLVGNKTYDFIHFHDLNALPAIKYLKKNGTYFIYDSHENFPEQMHETFGFPALIAYTWLERKYIKQVDAVLTPGERYSDIIRKKYKVESDIIANYPSKNDVETGHTLDIPPEYDKGSKFRCVYFGVMYNNVGYDKVVEAADIIKEQLSSDEIDFLIIGDGPAFNSMKQAIEQKGLNDYFILTGWMNYIQALSIIRTADVGLVLFQPGKNNYGRTPNRLYDYFSAGVPFIGSNFEGLKKGSRFEQPLGLFVDPTSPKDIAEKIMVFYNDEEMLQQYKESALESYKEKFQWDKEVKKLPEIYKNVTLSKKDIRND